MSGKSIIKVSYRHHIAWDFRKQIIELAKANNIAKSDARKAINPSIYRKIFFDVAWNRLIFDDVLIRLENKNRTKGVMYELRK